MLFLGLLALPPKAILYPCPLVARHLVRPGPEAPSHLGHDRGDPMPVSLRRAKSQHQQDHQRRRDRRLQLRQAPLQEP